MRRNLSILIFFLICTTAVAQMDKDGNFHWDELYMPDEVLELDMSLPNKVDVSAIKNREQVKYVKLKCYPWIEHIPFTPEDFPNIEALRIESFLIQGLNGIDGFKKIKRLEVTEVEGHSYARNFLRTNLPCVTNPVWEMSWLEELRIKGIDILVTENSISKLRSVKYLNINTFNEFYGCDFFDEFEKLASLRQIYFGKDNAEMTLYLAKIFSEKGVEVVGAFDVDNISSISVTKGDEEDYMLGFDSEKVEWDEIIRYRPWAFDEISRHVYDIKGDEITMYVKKQEGKVILIKSQWKNKWMQERMAYYNFNYKEDIRKYTLPTKKNMISSYFDFSNTINEEARIEILDMRLYVSNADTSYSCDESGIFVFSDTLKYEYNYSFYKGKEIYNKGGILTFYSPNERKGANLMGYLDVYRFAEYEYKKNLLREVGCRDCGNFIIHNNELVFGGSDITDFAVGCCCGDPWDCLDDDFDYFKNMKRGKSDEDRQELNLLYENSDMIVGFYRQQFEPILKYIKSLNVERLRNLYDF